MSQESDTKSEFLQAMQDVTPIQAPKKTPRRAPKPSAKPRQRRLDDQQVLQNLLSDPPADMELQPGDVLNFCRNGIQHQTFKKLRRGQYRVQDELDLHGLTSDEARQLLVDFLAQAKTRGLQCLRIIHGKGHHSDARGPVLKGKVAHWLKQRDDVLAYCSARPVDGGTGAVYVLLKRS